MPIYSMRTFRRPADTSSPARLPAMWKFAADDDAGATVKAWSHYGAVPKGDYAVLYGEANRQVLVLDGPARAAGTSSDPKVHSPVRANPRGRAAAANGTTNLTNHANGTEGASGGG